MNYVTIVFPDASATRKGTVNLPHRKGKQLKQYMHEPVLRHEGLLARSMRCYIYRSNGTPVRLYYEPIPGETITFVLAPRAAS